MPTLQELASLVDGRLDGPADLTVRNLAPLDDAGPEDLVFVKDERHVAELSSRRVGAVICRTEDDVGDVPAIRVLNPRIAAARVAAVLHPQPTPPPGIHPGALVAEDAQVPASCTVGPFAVLESGVILGEGVVVDAHVVLGKSVHVGEGSRIYPRVVCYPGVKMGARCEIHAGAVLGSPGFGFEPGPDGPVSFPQRGTVVLGDEVRIGANTTVDRATFTETAIGNRVKIDNLVQVGHNVTVHDNVMICALVGMGGGSEVKQGAIIGPQAACAPDSILGRGTVLGARAALASHQKLEAPGQVYMDAPPMPLGEWKRWTVWRVKGGWKKQSKS